MRIAVVGAGAVGCYFGGRLALAGQDVVFIARGKRLEALNAEGLTIVEPGEPARQLTVSATADPSEIGRVDTLLLCVKLFASEDALASCGPLLGPDTVVITLQNGVECAATAARVVGPERVVGAAVYVVAAMTAAASVARTGDWAALELAVLGTGATAGCERFAAACRSAAIGCTVRGDLETMLWSKFVLLAATSAMTAITRQPIGYVRSDPVALDVARACMSEAVAVARARGVELDAAVADDALRQLCEEMSPEAKASQLVDLENGRPLELEYLSGTIHRLGRELGVPTPVHSTVYAALRPFVHGRG
jgi:2-dehydropantoate 2-reductase